MAETSQVGFFPVLEMKRAEGFSAYFSNLVRFSPYRFVLACALNIASVVLSGAGLLMLVPLLHYTGWLPSPSEGGLMNRLLQYFPALHGKLSLLVVLGIFVGIISAVSALEYWRQSITAKLRLAFLFELQQKLNSSIARARWSYILTRKLQHAHHMVTVGLNQIEALTQYCLQLVSDVILLAVYLGFSLAISFRLTLLTSLVALVLLALQGRRKAFLTGQQYFLANRKLQDRLVQFLDGIKLAKGTNRVDPYTAHFNQILEEEQGHQLEFLQNQNAARASLSIISALIFCISFFIAVQFLRLQIATLIVLLVIFSRLMPRVSSAFQTYLRVINLAPVFSEMRKMEVEYEAERESDGTGEILVLSSGIRLQNVSYAYPESAAGLSDISCFIPAKSTTVIIGPSGAGKTTLADILLGLLTPHSGSIYADTVLLDEKKVLAWRACIGFVPQEVILFNDTVRANLTWGDQAADESQIWEALDTAAAAFVRRLPKGLDTLIGDKGSHLSGGERQRLALARALLRNPKVLLLDEATNALDVQNEEFIYDALQRLHGEMTIIIITHRRSTLRLADQVLELADGKLVENSVF